MEKVLSLLSQGAQSVFGVISNISIGDVLDIIILTLLIYKAIQLVRETHAGQLIKGVIYLLICSLAVNLLNMNIMKMVLQIVWEIGLIAIIVLFQPELRQLLEKLGKSKLGLLGRSGVQSEDEKALRAAIDGLVKASVSMSGSKTGALVVWEQSTILNDVVASGTVVDAIVSKELLCNLFYHNSPLHDGAVVIRGERIYAASCILPLTQSNEVNRELGTRHRAAIGMSENSDAVIIVVSEETGTVSVANKGELTRGYDSITLRTKLEELIIGDRFAGKAESKISKIKIWKRWSKGGREE